MTEVLSQDEINQLLEAISSASFSSEESNRISNQRRIKIYDFKRPDKFSKVQIRNFSRIHEKYARALTNTLTKARKDLVQVFVASVDQMTFEEFTRSVPSPTFLATLKMHPMGPIFIEVDKFGADILLTGRSNKDDSNNEFANLLDDQPARDLANNLIVNLKPAWENYCSCKDAVLIEELESNPQFLDAVFPEEMIVLITFECKLTDLDGESQEFMINLVYPSCSIDKKIENSLNGLYKSDKKKIINLMHKKHIGANSMTNIEDGYDDDEDNVKTAEQKREDRLGRLKDILVKVDVRLGATQQKLGDLFKIEEGTIVQLDKYAGDAVDIYVADRLFARGEVVVIDENFGVRVTEVMK